MSLLEQIKEKARAKVMRIVLPEGDEPRTVQAAGILKKEGLAEPILLGNPSDIMKTAQETKTDLSGIAIIDPKTSERAGEYAAALYEMRKAKGVTQEEAARLAADPMYYGIMMVKLSDADGLVSGAVHSTGDMLRPALQIIKTKPGTKVVSSSFLMELENKNIGQDGLLVYADCVVMPCPTAEELAHIAVSSAETARKLCGIEEPRVALLSFSTKGSAKHEVVTKVADAVEIAKKRFPDLCLDGELQLDAALVPEVGQLKSPGSPVAGYANTLVFPSLEAGNIGYKLVQRLAKADAYGPVLQGISMPVNDLSRGCSADDIVGVVAITAVQAQQA